LIKIPFDEPPRRNVAGRAVLENTGFAKIVGETTARDATGKRRDRLKNFAGFVTVKDLKPVCRKFMICWFSRAINGYCQVEKTSLALHGASLSSS
jgi:hypothetical protein